VSLQKTSRPQVSSSEGRCLTLMGNAGFIFGYHFCLVFENLFVRMKVEWRGWNGGVQFEKYDVRYQEPCYLYYQAYHRP
jgi:hypothetical protein